MKFGIFPPFTHKPLFKHGNSLCRIAIVICPVSFGLGRVVASLSIYGHQTYACVPSIRSRCDGNDARNGNGCSSPSEAGEHQSEWMLLGDASPTPAKCPGASCPPDVRHPRASLGHSTTPRCKRFGNTVYERHTVADWKRLERLITELQAAISPKCAAVADSR